MIQHKENVIIGKLIPAGTGLSRYHDIDIDVIQGRGQAEETLVSPITAE